MFRKKNANNCIKRFLAIPTLAASARDDRPIIHWQSAQSSWLRALSLPVRNEPLQDLSRSCNRCPEAASVRRSRRTFHRGAPRTPLVFIPAVAYVSQRIARGRLRFVAASRTGTRRSEMRQRWQRFRTVTKQINPWMFASRNGRLSK